MRDAVTASEIDSAAQNESIVLAMRTDPKPDNRVGLYVAEGPVPKPILTEQMERRALTRLNCKLG